MEEANQTLSFSEQMIGRKINMVGWFIHIVGVDRPASPIDTPYKYAETQGKLQGVGRVLSIGPLAFQDKNQTKKCKEGDYVWYWTHERTYDPIVKDGKTIHTYTITDDHIRAILTPEDADAIIRSRK
jgi:hypothetical protein